MSISVISSGFIGIPYSITFQGSKQGSFAATIKLTHYPRAGTERVFPIAFDGQSHGPKKAPGNARGFDVAAQCGDQYFAMIGPPNL
jgi:hypothetical protein